jgi:hypothetical protein
MACSCYLVGHIRLVRPSVLEAKRVADFRTEGAMLATQTAMVALKQHARRRVGKL